MESSFMPEQSPSFSILIGEAFKPITWKAGFDMDFSAGCLFCNHSELKGYQVEDEQGVAGKVAVCPQCFKVNARY